jgi:hypothetical protein
MQGHLTYILWSTWSISPGTLKCTVQVTEIEIYEAILQKQEVRFSLLINLISKITTGHTSFIAIEYCQTY